MRESTIERYLRKQVKKAGGTTRKMKGRKNDCDRIVIWPKHIGVLNCADVHFIECKAPGKEPRAGQIREHKRLRALGCRVFTLDTLEEVDDYVEGWR